MISPICIRLPSIRRFAKTPHPPELWWILLNHPGNIEAVVELKWDKSRRLFRLSDPAESCDQSSAGHGNGSVPALAMRLFLLQVLLHSPTWTDAFRVPNKGERMSKIHGRKSIKKQVRGGFHWRRRRLVWSWSAHL